MLLRIVSLSLCCLVVLGQGVQVDDDVAFLPSRVEYSLNFSWPIDRVLDLPPSGEIWDNQNAEQAENSGQPAPKWLFHLSCTKNKTDNARKLYLALRLESLPPDLKYFYGEAQCGILDVNGQLKNVVRTGLNVILPSFNLRFDPLIYRNHLLRDAVNLIRGPNQTMTVNCTITGLFKTEIVPFNETVDGEVVIKPYPSFMKVLEERGRLETNATYNVKLTLEIPNFVAWPLVYYNGNVTFNEVSGDVTSGFRYQLRTYNPANSRYPLYLWVGSIPQETSTFKGSVTCGLMDVDSKKISGETAILDGSETSPSGFNHYFFSFQYALDYDLVQTNLKVTSYGVSAAQIYCDMNGTFFIWSPS